MAYVIGPNGLKNFIPDDVAASMVGDGNGEYRYAPEPEPEPAPAPKRTPRRTAK